jgi:hypothetical protein
VILLSGVFGPAAGPAVVPGGRGFHEPFGVISLVGTGLDWSAGVWEEPEPVEDGGEELRSGR